MVNIRVNVSDDLGPLDHFWRATGFSPAELLLDDDMKGALAYLGSIPHGGITYVRVHYLLNLVRATGLGSERPAYDWSLLDEGLDPLVKNGLVPFFELMGNPEGYFNDFTDTARLHGWKRLVRDLACHLIERYSPEEVRTWYFETWNEPDIGFWRGSDEAFLNYYDACSEGLREADPALRFGGPGSARTLAPLFKTLLAHCDAGTNVFTGERGVRLDFISVHEKGVKKHREDLTPRTAAITEREAAAVLYLREHHPRLAGVPFMNNECDPQVGWQDPHTWHARPYYAALAAKIIGQHLGTLIDGLGRPYALLSNDNGFLGTWGQRTLLTRFGERALSSGQAKHQTVLRDAPEPLAFEFVKKPIFNLMVMLARLGDRRCGALLSEAGDVGILATRRGEEQVAVLVYNSRDKITASGETPVRLQLSGLPFDEAVLAHYRIDEAHGDPFTVWEGMGDPTQPAAKHLGAPDLPSAEQYDELWRHQELALLEPPRAVHVEGGQLELAFTLPLPAVSLLLLSRRPEAPPGRPQGLRAEAYRGLTERENVLLVWQGPESRFIHTFEVLFAPSEDGLFERLNEVDLLCTAFLHARTPGTRGVYKIRAVDYWGRAGEASEPVGA